MLNNREFDKNQQMLNENEIFVKVQSCMKSELVERIKNDGWLKREQNLAEQNSSTIKKISDLESEQKYLLKRKNQLRWKLFSYERKMVLEKLKVVANRLLREKDTLYELSMQQVEANELFIRHTYLVNLLKRIEKATSFGELGISLAEGFEILRRCNVAVNNAKPTKHSALTSNFLFNSTKLLKQSGATKTQQGPESEL